MKGGFLGKLDRKMSIIVIVGIVVVVIISLGLGLGLGLKKNVSNSPTGTPTSVADLGFSLKGVPAGCADKLGCANTNVSLTVTPNNIQAARDGTINWTLKAYSSGGGIYNDQGSTPISALGNNTEFSILLGNGNTAINSAQVKVSITKDSITSGVQYYNYTV
jgi:hypothetical protein